MKTQNKILLSRILQTPIMAARSLLGRGPVTIARRGGLSWRLDLREAIDFSIFALGAFEPQTVCRYRGIVQPGDTVLDIGANIGAHTLPLANLVGPSGKVIACEATAHAFAKLQANIGLNPRLEGRIVASQTIVMAGHRDLAPRELYSSWPLAAAPDLHSKHLGRMQSTEGATVATLDEIIDQHGIDQVRLIKIDVDGFECAVLKGGKKLLSDFRPVIVMELCPYVLAEHDGSVHELLGILKEAQYKLRDIKEKRDLPMEELSLCTMIPDGAGVNVIARPTQRTR
jgi:FkbM family methyltransferase